MSYLKHDFEDELADALAQAREQNKQVLIEFGGDWCIWSKRMERVLAKSDMDRLITDNFLFLRCYMGYDGEHYFPFDRIDEPNLKSVPYFILLNTDCEVVASSSTEQFEFWRFYRKGKLKKFLQRWAARNYAVA